MMIVDFIIGVIASIVASIICGFFTKWVFGKNNDILTSIYTIYIAFSSFVFVILLTFLLSGDLQKTIASWTGQNVFTLIKLVLSHFWILFICVTLVTIIFLIIRQIEINTKNIDKVHKRTMDYYNSHNKESNNK